MNKLGHSFNMSNWSASAVAVLVGGFLAFNGHTGWAFASFILAVVLGMLNGS